MLNSFKVVWPLFVCQSLAFSCVTQMIFSVSIVGKLLASEQWATLPIALMPIGTALGILPATKLMSIFGRRLVFILFLFTLALSNLLAAFAIHVQSFLWLCVASLWVGVSLSALSQLRFAAMELVSKEQQAGAASVVLLGGIVAAILGPELGLRGSELFTQQFVGSYVLMACLAFAALPFLYPIDTKVIKHDKKSAGRSLSILFKQNDFLLAVSAAAVAYGVMSFIMTATPISMHQHFGFSLSDTKWVIQSHIMAMFLPSLLSAWIVKHLGIQKMMLLGVVAFALAIITAFVDHRLIAFWFALVLLGLGWNFLYVAGTVLLPSTHQENEKYKAQGFNDFVVFSIQAVVALSAGILLSLLGWQWMLLCCLPLLVWHSYLLRKPLEAKFS